MKSTSSTISQQFKLPGGEAEFMCSRQWEKSVSKATTGHRIVLSVIFCGIISALAADGAQQAGGVQATGPTVRMVRSVAGTKGETRGGSYVILDPRTTFYVPDDRQVIVYFEWEAPKGVHHCEGTVKGPNGQLAVMSSFDYPATQTKFGGFWTMPLLENSSPGLWTFESRVDGESAGELRFEIVSSKRPAEASKEEALPTPAEIYSHTVAATVLIEKLDEKGQVLGVGSGFFSGDDSLLTAFRVIDGAHTLRIQFADGTHIQTDSVAAWDRRKDWAILKVDASKKGILRMSDSKSWSIGDHCYWLDTKTGGGRVIADGQIVGKETREGWGERISISNIASNPATGGPLLNERGEVLGLLGGTTPENLVAQAVRDSSADGGGTYAITGTAIPIGLVKPSAQPTSARLQTLWASGEFTPQVTAARNVTFGMITLGKPTKGGAPFLKEMKHDFTRQDNQVTVYVAFQSSDTLKTTVQMQMYDADNHMASRGEPVKVTLRRGETQDRYWSFSAATLVPGIYRTDVLLGEAVAWRTYFRVRE
jgi:S1-C subfamily serine protease